MRPDTFVYITADWRAVVEPFAACVFEIAALRVISVIRSKRSWPICIVASCFYHADRGGERIVLTAANDSFLSVIDELIDCRLCRM